MWVVWRKDTALELFLLVAGVLANVSLLGSVLSSHARFSVQTCANHPFREPSPRVLHSSSCEKANLLCLGKGFYKNTLEEETALLCVPSAPPTWPGCFSFYTRLLLDNWKTTEKCNGSSAQSQHGIRVILYSGLRAFSKPVILGRSWQDKCCWKKSLCLALSLPLLFSSFKERNATGESKFIYFPDILSSAEH